MNTRRATVLTSLGVKDKIDIASVLFDWILEERECLPNWLETRGYILVRVDSARRFCDSIAKNIRVRGRICLESVEKVCYEGSERVKCVISSVSYRCDLGVEAHQIHISKIYKKLRNTKILACKVSQTVYNHRGNSFSCPDYIGADSCEVQVNCNTVPVSINMLYKQQEKIQGKTYF